MSRFVSAFPSGVTLPLGVGFRRNTTTGLYDVDAASPIPATAPLAATDTLMSGSGALAYTPAQVAAALLGAGFKLNATTKLYDIDGAAAAAATGNPSAAATLLSGDAATSYTLTQLAATLAPLLAPILGSSSSSGTTPTPNPTPAATPTAFASPLTFAGPAGVPTGIRALTPYGSAGDAGMVLDGNGNLLFGSTNYARGILAAAGAVPAAGATMTATFASGLAGASSLGRMDATGANGCYAIWTANSVVIFVTVANGVETSGQKIDAGTYAYNIPNWGIRMDSGGVWHLQIAGADVANASCTPPALATGYLLVGNGFDNHEGFSQVAVA